MRAILIYALVAVSSYLLGSLNFGVILSKKLVHDDVRSHGSGNAGTTNMLRNYGKIPALLTIIGDMAKVAVAILISFALLKATDTISTLSETFGDNTNIIIKSFSGLFCVLGHIYPCFFGFKGGKGVATSGGMVFMIDWRIALILLAMFIITVAATKYVSLGSIIMALFYPVFILLFHKSIVLFAIACLFAAIVIVKHKDNIKKLINHTESIISFSKKTE